MGMYFNTEQTAKMVGRLNVHFGPASNSKASIDDKRPKKGWFKKAGSGKISLSDAATKLNIDPDSQEDPGNVHKNNWHTWLTTIEDSHLAPSQNLDNVPIPPNACPPKTGPANSTVGIEVAQLIYQGLDDQHCEEIVFVALPGSSISVDQPWTFGSANAYSLVITVRTMEMDAVKAAIRRIARIRSAKRAKAKKKP